MANYSNADILNLFYIYGECDRVLVRTCVTFNERYPHLRRMTKSKFRKMERNFIANGNVNTQRNVQYPVTNDEENEINVIAYFTAFPNSSVRAAEYELGR